MRDSRAEVLWPRISQILRDDTASTEDQAGLWKTNPLRVTSYIETAPESNSLGAA